MILLTADEMLEFGLELAGDKVSNSNKVNDRRFRALYGSASVVCSVIWEALQTTAILEARIEPRSRKDLKYFMVAMYFLKVYPTENVIHTAFKLDEKTIRTHSWFYAKKLRALQDDKVEWDGNWSAFFGMSADGVHFRCMEEEHPVLSKNPQQCSYKFKSAGWNYVIGLSILTSAIMWLSDQYPASVHDITVFRNEALPNVPAGKMVVADNGFRGEPDTCATPSSLDPDELKEFKRRARSRQETFNARIKNFSVLSERFRHHSAEQHQICFVACCIIVQFQMELGSPLFDV